MPRVITRQIVTYPKREVTGKLHPDKDMREELEQRPLLTASLALILGLTLLANPWNLLFVPILAVAGQTKRYRLTILLGLIVGIAIHPTLPRQGLTSQEYVSGNVQLLSVPRIRPYGQITEIETQGMRLYLSLPLAMEASLGDTFHISGVAKPLSEAAEQAALNHGVVGTIKCDSPMLVHNAPFVVSWTGNVRRDFLRICDQTLSPRSAAIVDAVCFNVDGLLDDQTRDELQRTGTIHIVSASGLHVLLFGLFIGAAVSILPLPRPVQLFLVALCLVLYALAAGLQTAVLRSIIMAALAASAYIVRREADLLSALGLSAILLLLWKPESVFQLGFQFSFLVVAALALFRTHARGKGVLEQAKATLQGSFTATAAAAPLTAQSFGIFSVLAILANVLIGIVVGPIIGAALLALAVKPISSNLTVGLMKAIVEPLSGWIAYILDTLGQSPVAAIEVPKISGYFAVLIYASFLLIWRKRVRPA